MRTSALLQALLIAASASAQTVNTQINGITLTNGLSTITNSSVFDNIPNQSTGINYLTDNNTTTWVANIGQNHAGVLEGNFGGTVSSSATGVYIICVGGFARFPDVGRSFNGGMTVSLDLKNSGSTISKSFTDADFSFNLSQLLIGIPYYQTVDGNVGINNSVQIYAYIYAPFSDFGTTYDQVVGIELSNFVSAYPDIGYIGLGYSGSPAVPEPSTYGLILGGLALAGAAVRRRKNSK